jgi:quercetin dioxygenase-like cupin family protein
MDILDLKGSLKFSPDHHVYTTLSDTPHSDTPHSSISIVGWEPGQTSPIHCHPEADEIYHVLEGEGLFDDGRTERRLGPGDTVIFPAGEVHRVRSLTRMVLYRVQAGPNRGAQPADGWPAARTSSREGASA